MTDLTPQTTESGQVTARSKNVRIDKINKFLDEQIHEVLKDLSNSSSDLDCIIDIVRDRIIQSTEPGHVIALARLEELKLEATRQRVNILKTVVTDKGNELASTKKSAANEIADILSGGMFGLALGAQVGKSQYGNSVSNVSEVIDVSSETVIVETEHLGNIAPTDIEALLKSSIPITDIPAE